MKMDILTSVKSINLSDADSDKYAVEVQNHDGYYDSNGNYVAFAEER